MEVAKLEVVNVQESHWWLSVYRNTVGLDVRNVRISSTNIRSQCGEIKRGRTIYLQDSEEIAAKYTAVEIHLSLVTYLSNLHMILVLHACASY